MKRSLCAAGALLSLGLITCSRVQHYPPPPAATGDEGGAGGGDLIDVSGPSGPPAVDAGGLCGNELHQLVFDAPNIYFVFDASGSMAVYAGSSTRYERVRSAAYSLIRKLGPLINVGAAIFPRDATNAEPCHPGAEVLAVRPGDPITGKVGPTSAAFVKATQLAPFGGTPTAATLAELTPTLTALTGRTIVILATDGGPNCNLAAMCGVEDCMANIEDQCSPETNCCAPGGESGPALCVDRQASVDAVAAIKAANIPVYVLGIPGSETYGGVLDDLAIAGGAPRLSAPFYYKITDFNALGAALGEIAASAVSCTFDVADPPKDAGFTNVYFDQTVVPYDATDGWIWKTPSVVELHGKACQQLKSGEVGAVQIVSGCPTEAPK